MKTRNMNSYQQRQNPQHDDDEQSDLENEMDVDLDELSPLGTNDYSAHIVEDDSDNNAGGVLLDRVPGPLGPQRQTRQGGNQLHASPGIGQQMQQLRLGSATTPGRVSPPQQHGPRRDERVKQRGTRIKRLQAADRAQERRLLGANPSNRPVSQMHNSRAHLNVPEYWETNASDPDRFYITDILWEDFKRHLPPKQIESVKQNVGDWNWVRKTFLGHELDKTNYTIPKDEWAMSFPNYTANQVSILRLFSNEVQALKKHKRIPRNWDKVEAAFKLYDRLRLRRRFLDVNNPVLQSVPTPDGSNITDPDLRRSWVLYRAWIRTLHYRTLSVPGSGSTGEQPSPGFAQLRSILPCVLAALEREILETGRSDNSYHDNADMRDTRTACRIPPHFNFIVQLGESLMEAIEGLAQDFLTDPRPTTPNGRHLAHDTMEYNAKDNVAFEAMVKKHLGPLSRDLNLYSLLIDAAENFEDRMSILHVEDYRIDNRIVLRDEFCDVDSFLAQQPHNRFPPTVHNLASNDDTSRYKHVKAYLNNISAVNRHRRNYLLLRDWSKKRPWLQLYHVFDTRPGELDYLIDPIKKFYEKIEGLKTLSASSFYTSPSNPSNVFSSLFPIHPISSISPPFRLVNSIPHYTAGCLICVSEFEPRETLAELHCHHLFHYTCLRTYWDQFGRHQFSCPTCRNRIPRLHEIAGIAPEVSDVWDFVDVVGEEWAASHPEDMLNEWDNQGHWAHSELMRLLRSQNWVRENPDQPRETEVEMALLRHFRWEKYIQATPDLKQYPPHDRRSGIEGLDTGSVW